jgi:hypothetical protein
MGEYEDRYPEAYAVEPATAEERVRRYQTTGSEVIHPRSRAVAEPRPRSLVDRLGLSGAAERMRAWQHRPAEPDPALARTIPEPLPERVAGAQYVPPADPDAALTAVPPDLSAVHRGSGPRGYSRRPERIREDLCDRLTENPFIDASDIDVAVTGSEVVLTGTVDSDIALRQTQAIAQEVIGVTRVDSRLGIRGGETHPTVGDRVNAALAGLRTR